MLLALMVVIGIVANPNTISQKIDGFEWLPVNLYINGDTFYYVLYGMLGRAIGMMDTQKRGLNWLCGALFIAGVAVISRGTLHELQWRGNFADTGICIAGRWSLSVPYRCSRSLKHLERASPSRAGLYLAALAGNLRFSRAGDPRPANKGR